MKTRAARLRRPVSGVRQRRPEIVVTDVVDEIREENEAEMDTYIMA